MASENGGTRLTTWLLQAILGILIMVVGFWASTLQSEVKDLRVATQAKFDRVNENAAGVAGALGALKAEVMATGRSTEDRLRSIERKLDTLVDGRRQGGRK